MISNGIRPYNRLIKFCDMNTFFFTMWYSIFI